MKDRDVEEVFQEIGRALSSGSGGKREERIAAAEGALEARLAGLGREEAEAMLAALESRFPVRATPAEEECRQLQDEVATLRARVSALETEKTILEDKLRRGAQEEVHFCLENLTGKTLQPGPEDSKKLSAIVGVLAESVNKTIGYANVGLDRWEFKDAKFSHLEEMVRSCIQEPPEKLAASLRAELEKMRDLIKAMIKADLQFTPKWCEGSQARFAREVFEAGVSKAKAWEKYAEFIQTYSFRADLMQGLRTFIDGERQRSSS